MRQLLGGQPRRFYFRPPPKHGATRGFCLPAAISRTSVTGKKHIAISDPEIIQGEINGRIDKPVAFNCGRDSTKNVPPAAPFDVRHVTATQLAGSDTRNSIRQFLCGNIPKGHSHVSARTRPISFIGRPSSCQLTPSTGPCGNQLDSRCQPSDVTRISVTFRP